jgi:hypothetical protein
MLHGMRRRDQRRWGWDRRRRYRGNGEGEFVGEETLRRRRRNFFIKKEEEEEWTKGMKEEIKEGIKEDDGDERKRFYDLLELEIKNQNNIFWFIILFYNYLNLCKCHVYMYAQSASATYAKMWQIITEVGPETFLKNKKFCRDWFQNFFLPGTETQTRYYL